MKTVWIEAMRPRTLPLAVASIVMGTAVAASEGSFNWLVAVLCVLTAVFLQILSNLANDYGDSQHGADHAERLGPKRAVQSGLISSQAMLRGMILFGVLSAVSGLTMLWLAFGRDGAQLLLVFVLLGAAAIVAAITYTAGLRPYGYAGLGDIAVLLFFGWVGGMGPYFLQTRQLNWPIFLMATSVGLLAVGVLNVNNIRDIESDKVAGKQSIPVRIGPHRARVYHWVLLGLALATAVTFPLVTRQSPWQFLFLLAVPLLVKHGTAVWQTHDPIKLNPLLKQLSLITLLFVLLFSIGQFL